VYTKNTPVDFSLASHCLSLGAA